MLTHAAVTDDRSQRACDPTFLADELAEIVVRDMETKHDRVGLVDALDAHGVRLIDELASEVL